MKHVLYVALIVVGLAAFVWASSTQGDWGVGGNLDVTGTSVCRGALTVLAGITGDFDCTTAEVDTLKPGSGTAFYLRAFDGQNDADLNVFDISATTLSGSLTGSVAGDLTGDVDAGIAEVDTLKPGSGTVFYLRASDGQSDAILSVYDVSATNDVSAATFTGDLVGAAVQEAVYVGNLPSAVGLKFHLYANSAADSVWMSNGSTWSLLLP